MIPFFAVGRKAGFFVPADGVAVSAADVRLDTDVEEAVGTCPAAVKGEVFVEVDSHCVVRLYG